MEDAALRLRIDLHVHTVASGDAYTTPQDLVRFAKMKNLDGVAITEHDVLTNLQVSGIIIIRGVEVSTCEGHVIALGIEKPIKIGLSAAETIKLIRDAGGISIVPHPYDYVSPCVKLGNLDVKPDAVEVINADSLLFGISSWLAKRDASRLGIPMVGGSDSHIPNTIGDAYTIIEAESDSTGDILTAIREGRTAPYGRPSSIANKMRKVVMKMTG